MRAYTEWRIVMAALATALSLSVACGTSGPPSNPRPAVASATAVASPESVATQSAYALVENATDNKFSQTGMNIHAGQTYSLAMFNKGQAVHNLRIENAKAPDGKDIAVPLVEPGKSAVVSFAIAKAGTYQFVCDVHPTEMRGTITVDQG